MADRQVRSMQRDDIEQVLALWKDSDGIGLRPVDDDLPAIEKFLNLNPDLSLVAIVHGDIVGAVLCGSDGRRGYLHHLAVRSDVRRVGIGRELAEHAMERYRKSGIRKVSIDVFAENHDAQEFWRAIGFHDRSDIQRMSFILNDTP